MIYLEPPQNDQNKQIKHEDSPLIYGLVHINNGVEASKLNISQLPAMTQRTIEFNHFCLSPLEFTSSQLELTRGEAGFRLAAEKYYIPSDDCRV